MHTKCIYIYKSLSKYGIHFVCKSLSKCGKHFVCKYFAYILYTFCIQNVYKSLLKCDDDDDDDDDELFLWYGWLTKDVLAFFPVGTIVRDPYHHEFRHATSWVWTWSTKSVHHKHHVYNLYIYKFHTECIYK